MSTVFGRIYDECNFPSEEDLSDGLKLDVMYVDTWTDTLQKYIDQVKMIGAYMLNNYMESEEDGHESGASILSWEESCELLKRYDGAEQMDFSDSAYFDDMFFLGKYKENEVIYFWLHRSGRCDICRIWTNMENERLMEDLKEYIKESINHGHASDFEDHIVLLPESYFRNCSHIKLD